MRSRCSLALVLLCAGWPLAAYSQRCDADYDGDGLVTIEEVVGRVGPTPVGMALDAVQAALVGCTPATPTPTPTLPAVASRWTPGVFASAQVFASRCQSPRRGVDPTTGERYPDRQGTWVDENDWLRSWTHSTYLWYREVVDRDPSRFHTAAYFELLRTHALTASGRPRDQFHFSLPTAEYRRESETGAAVGYGMQLVSFPDRTLRVAYTEPDSPAASASLQRGDEIVAVDGVDVRAASAPAWDIVWRGLLPSDEGEVHLFTVRTVAGQVQHQITLRAAVVTTAPVRTLRILRNGPEAIGYLLFNSHIATAEAALIDAVGELARQRIAALVLDLRYNGGGYVDIANQLAFMIAGASRTAGRLFEQARFNDRYRPLDFSFHRTSQGLSVTAGRPLPSLNLGRLYVLTGAGTCSASESIINGLRGVDVEVIQIGTSTCGKPYLFYPADNCGTTYFSIQGQLVNAKGFGAYDDGFVPRSTATGSEAVLPGCLVPDDFTRELGDPGEGRLAAALRWHATGTCDDDTIRRRAPRSGGEGRIVRPPWQEDRRWRP